MPGLARPEPVQARLGQPRNGLGPRRVFFEPVQKQTLPWASWSIKGIPLPNCSTKGFPSMAVLPAQLPAQPGPPEPLTSFFLNRFKKQSSVIKKLVRGPWARACLGTDSDEIPQGSHPNTDEDPQFLIRQRPAEGGDEELHKIRPW